MMVRLQAFVAVASVALISLAGCGGGTSTLDGGSGSGSSESVTIQISGSDTMINLAQAWAEAYNMRHPEVSIQVRGGGSGVGIADLIAGKVTMANASRKMKAKEMAEAEKHTGKEPVEFIVGMDALAIFAHKDNPIESISLEQLADVYGENGAANKWTDVGIDLDSEIVLISRQNSSGTYAYFKEAVLDKGNFRNSCIAQSGSADVAAAVATTPGAIGYSGMGYLTQDIKGVPVSAETGGEAYAPTLENAEAGNYPIARPLHIYTAGEPEGALKEYLDWIMSDAGQKILVDKGYVPAPK